MTLHQLSLTLTGVEGRGRFRISALKLENGQIRLLAGVCRCTLTRSWLMANTSVSADTACICVSFEQALLPHDLRSLRGQELQVYCSLVDIDHSYMADSYAMDANGMVIRYIEGMFCKKVSSRIFEAHLSCQAPQGSESELPHGPEVSNHIHVSGIEMGHSVLPSRPAVDSTVVSVIRDVSEMEFYPGPSRSLPSVGIDSLFCIELRQTLEKMFNISISHSALEDCGIVRNVIYILAGLQISSQSQISSLSATPGDFSVASCLRQEPWTPDIQVNKTLQQESHVLLESLFLGVCGLEFTKDDGNIYLSSLGVDSPGHWAR